MTTEKALREALTEILRVHANDNPKPKAFYIAADAALSLPETEGEPVAWEPQRSDCNYDGDTTRCDKDCAQIGACKRRTQAAGKAVENFPAILRSPFNACMFKEQCIQQAEKVAAPPSQPVAWLEWREKLAQMVDDYINEKYEDEGGEEAYDALKAHILKTPFAALFLPETVGEPVAWILKTGHGTKLVEVKPPCVVDLWRPLVYGDVAPPSQPAQGEPVAWVECDGELVWQNKAAAIGRNLYTRQSVPAGMKLVPVEPTPEMLTAGYPSASEEAQSWGIAEVYRAMLAAAPAAQPAQGWKLVPVEPTDAMLSVWLSETERSGGVSGGNTVPWMRAIRRYRAMLAAAPAAPTNGEE